MLFRSVDNDATGVDGNPIAAPGILTNTARFLYNNGTSAVGIQPTNSVDFTVTQTAAVAANDSSTGNALDGSNGIDGTTPLTVGDNVVEVASAGQGTVVVFDNYIWNNGNGVDKFNITYANTNFPSGTSFQLFQADGVNVLQDTNSDGIPDTGAMNPGANYKVVLKATLPANATNVGAPFTVVKRATSVVDPTKTDFVNDRLLAIAPNVVDLANSAANSVLGAGGATDAGVANGGAGVNGAWSTKAINPGATATFPLFITNKVGQADNYNLSADNDSSTLNAVAFPAGWTVVFREDASGVAANCSTTGATITNTGTINALAQKLVCAVVSVPATQAPLASQDVYFRTISPVTGAQDTKLDAVTVNTLRNIQMTSDNTGQVFPGGSVVYTHIVTNNGNVVEGSASGEITFTGVNTAPGFSTVIYIDTNNDGSLDVGDQAITATNFQTLTTAGAVGNGVSGLSPAESVRIFVKVLAPASATPGTTDAATITAVVTGVINVAAPASPVNTDTTNVIGGQIRLDKTQSLDADCNGTSDSGTFAVGNISALPGACIMYRIVATNEGVSQVTGIVISDATPAFTKLAVTPSPAPAIVFPVTVPVTTGGTTGVSTNLATGSLGATVSKLDGAATATFSFSVKIDQ